MGSKVCARGAVTSIIAMTSIIVFNGLVGGPSSGAAWAGQGNQSPAAPATTRPTDYMVGPQDVLTVVMFADPTLSGRYSVESDGHFTFPLVGKVRAGGLTTPAIETALKGKLAEGFFKNPQLTVAVESFRSQRIFVVGQVTKPNAYPLSGEMTLLEALALAGPITPNAGDEVLIVRPRQGAVVRIFTKHIPADPQNMGTRYRS